MREKKAMEKIYSDQMMYIRQVLDNDKQFFFSFGNITSGNNGHRVGCDILLCFLIVSTTWIMNPTIQTMQLSTYMSYLPGLENW